MKLLSCDKKITRSENFVENTFRIAASSKAFDILSGKIYSNPIRAIIRELSTNAYDAHVSVGKAKEPFRVHLPTIFEPYFSIRDFGPGLSEADVKNIYTVYFASTRNLSDEFTGCLGLGSKSPFAYVESFIVTSYHDGRQRVYSLFKNEDGVPAISLMSDSESTEPSGIEIKIAVKNHDISRFLDEANYVYYFFETTPILNKVDVSHKIVPTMSGAGYKLFRFSNIGRWTDSYICIKMGQVCYAVKGTYDHPHKDGTLILDAEMGSCSIAASREEILEDRKTIEHIRNLLNAATNAIKQDIDKQAKLCQNELEKLVYYRQVSESFGLSGVKCLIDLQPANKEYNVGRLTASQGWRAKHPSLDMMDFGHPYPATRHLGSDSYIISPHCDDSRFRFIHFDVPDVSKSRKLKNRIIHYIKENPNNTFLWAEINDMNKFVAVFGNNIVKVSTLPDPPPSQNVNNTDYVRASFKELIGADWRSVSVPLETKDAAIAIRDYDHVILNGTVFRLRSMSKIANLLGIKHVYGVTQSDYKRLVKKSGLPELNSLAKDYANKLTINNVEYAYMKDSSSMPSINTKLVKELAAIDGIFDDWMNFTLVRADRERYDAINSLRQAFSLKVNVKGEVKMDKIYKQYPLLKYLDLVDIPNSAVIDYVKSLKGVNK